MIMETKPLVSIVVPVYNSEKYIGECVEMLLSQTYENIEIILVDDGSTDNSYNICKSFSDERISLYKKENGGASSARNFGMQYANGKYLFFSDSDDHVEKNAIEVLTNTAEKYSSDCVYYEADNYTESADIKIKEGGLLQRNDYPPMAGNELIPQLINNRDYHVPPFLYFVNRSVLGSLSFEEGIIFEDELFAFNLLRKCSNVVCLRRELYHRRVRAGSVMTSKGKEKHRFVSISTVFDRLVEQRNDEKDAVLNMYTARIGMLLFGYWDAVKGDEKQELKAKYSEIKKRILSEKGFGSKELVVRCFGFIPWAAYVAPGKIIKRIKSRV